MAAAGQQDPRTCLVIGCGVAVATTWTMASDSLRNLLMPENEKRSTRKGHTRAPGRL